MSNNTTENFAQAMAKFEWPDSQPISYRLYYTEDGSPECYTMEHLPGKYIEVDRETYILHRWNVKVVDQKLVIIPPTIKVNKLVDNTESGTPCHLQDVCVVVDETVSHKKWNMITNEIS